MALISFGTKETIIMSETRSFWLAWGKCWPITDEVDVHFTDQVDANQQAQAAMIR